MRRAVRTERDDLAVHDQLGHRERSHGIDDFGNGRRDVAQIPREDTDLVAALVRLDPRAVQLPLEGDVVLQLHQRSVHVFRWLRQHRLNGLKQLNAERGETGFAVHDCRACDRCERACHHHRAS